MFPPPGRKRGPPDTSREHISQKLKQYETACKSFVTFLEDVQKQTVETRDTATGNVINLPRSIQLGLPAVYFQRVEALHSRTGELLNVLKGPPTANGLCILDLPDELLVHILANTGNYRAIRRTCSKFRQILNQLVGLHLQCPVKLPPAGDHFWTFVNEGRFTWASVRIDYDNRQSDFVRNRLSTFDMLLVGFNDRKPCSAKVAQFKARVEELRKSSGVEPLICLGGTDPGLSFLEKVALIPLKASHLRLYQNDSLELIKAYKQTPQSLELTLSSDCFADPCLENLAADTLILDATDFATIISKRLERSILTTPLRLCYSLVNTFNKSTYNSYREWKRPISEVNIVARIFPGKLIRRLRKAWPTVPIYVMATNNPPTEVNDPHLFIRITKLKYRRIIVHDWRAYLDHKKTLFEVYSA